MDNPDVLARAILATASDAIVAAEMRTLRQKLAAAGSAGPSAA
jgi:hypothetical protein